MEELLIILFTLLKIAFYIWIVIEPFIGLCGG